MKANIRRLLQKPIFRSTLYMLATYVLSEIFFRIEAPGCFNDYLLTQRTVVFSVCCMGGFLLYEIHHYIVKPTAKQEEKDSEDHADP